MTCILSTFSLPHLVFCKFFGVRNVGTWVAIYCYLHFSTMPICNRYSKRGENGLTHRRLQHIPSVIFYQYIATFLKW